MSDEATPELKAIKITDPRWVGMISAVIHDYFERIKIPSITYETLYTYFVNTVQYGGGTAEFWVVFESDKPIAFAHWYAKGLPYRGVVHCDHVYSWNRMSEPLALLIEQFLDFGYRNHAMLFEGNATNEAVVRVLTKAAGKKGIKLERTELINLFGRKQKNG